MKNKSLGWDLLTLFWIIFGIALVVSIYLSFQSYEEGFTGMAAMLAPFYYGIMIYLFSAITLSLMRAFSTKANSYDTTDPVIIKKRKRKALYVGIGIIIFLLLPTIIISLAKTLDYFHVPCSNCDNQKVNTFLSGVGKCGFLVTEPEKIYLPHLFQGLIDNSHAQELGCSWQMFEGQAGTAQLYYYDRPTWKKIGDSVPIKTSYWTATSSAISVMLGSNNEVALLSYGTKMKVIFTEENVSGMGQPDTYELPFILWDGQIK